MSNFQTQVHSLKGRFVELPRDHVYAFVVELEKSVVVVDSTLALSSSQELRTLAETFNKPIDSVIMTHGHPDHYSGLDTFKDLPILGSKGCLKFAHEEDIRKAPTATYLLGNDWPAIRTFPNEIISDTYTKIFDGVQFSFQDFGPGESDSDGIWSFKADGIEHVFVGDLISNHTHNFFMDGHTNEWLKILDYIIKTYNHHTRFYYGHGEPTIGTDLALWTKGYIMTFIDAVKKLQNPKFPLSEANQQFLINEMKTYLPNDVLLFLMTYELSECVENFIKKI